MSGLQLLIFLHHIHIIITSLSTTAAAAGHILASASQSPVHIPHTTRSSVWNLILFVVLGDDAG